MKCYEIISANGQALKQLGKAHPSPMAYRYLINVQKVENMF
jgi:hypothetical protein